MVRWKESYPIRGFCDDLKNPGSMTRNFMGYMVHSLSEGLFYMIVLMGISHGIFYYSGRSGFFINPEMENSIYESKIFPDSVKLDSLPDSVFTPKPQPLEGILLE